MLTPGRLTGFKHILIFGVYILSIFNLPRSTSMSLSFRSMEDGSTSKQSRNVEDDWWIMSFDKNNTGKSDPDSICTFVKSMCDQSNIAKYNGALFQNTYKLKDPISFMNKFFPDVNSEGKASDEIDGSQFKNLELNEFVIKIYQYLQKVAVGIDAVNRTYDSAFLDDNASDFKNDIERQILSIRNLLFEINDYISAYDITPLEDVQKIHFPAEYIPSEMSATHYKLLSNVCVQGYVRTLNYVHAGLTHFNQTDCK